MSNIFIPVILGTPRQGRMSEPVANFVYDNQPSYLPEWELSKWIKKKSYE